MGNLIGMNGMWLIFFFEFWGIFVLLVIYIDEIV